MSKQITDHAIKPMTCYYDHTTFQNVYTFQFTLSKSGILETLDQVQGRSEHTCIFIHKPIHQSFFFTAAESQKLRYINPTHSTEKSFHSSTSSLTTAQTTNSKQSFLHSSKNRFIRFPNQVSLTNPKS